MKQILCLCCLAAGSLQAMAQNPIDAYLTGTNTFTVIGSSTNDLTAPHDLDFVPGRPNEWWVLNKEADGASIVIFYNAGTGAQSSEFRRDSHNDHFMARSVAIAMGDNGTFASAQEIKNTASPSSTFMGPALWSSDTSVFARRNQNNWDPNKPLGSHLDMLHQSPFGMGIAHDHDNVYWYFDGYNGNICKYDFAMPHSIGGDDHSDGKIYRYSSVTVKRKANLPSHLALDKQNSWLYIIDGGTNRVIRLKTTSGTVGGNLSVPSSASEPLAAYKEMMNPITETVATGLTAPCGIDYRKDRVIISDNATGEIIIYNVSSIPAIEVGRINTGAAGIMGLRIDDNNKIWYVNKTTKQLVRIDNPNVLAIDGMLVNSFDFSVYPNPSSGKFTLALGSADEVLVSITNVVGKVIKSFTKPAGNKNLEIDLADQVPGTYTVKMKSGDKSGFQRITLN